MGDDGGIRISLVDHRPEGNPAALHEFARERGLHVERWDWLTGTQQNIDQLMNALEPVGPPPELNDENKEIRKKTPLLAAVFIVDQDGGIRGRYASDSKGLAEVFHRSRHVFFASNPH
jgi:cytochrome oxidase Cu insertion factor (SCO1/SenC/PrrC family)